MEAMEGLHLNDHTGVLERLFASFAELDTNHDGVLSWDEIWKPMKKIQEKVENKSFSWKIDYGITTKEFTKMVREMFEVADFNKTNVLEEDEFKHFSLYLAEAVGSMPFAEPENVMEGMFERFDINKDGVLSWEEIFVSVQPILAMIRMKEFSWHATADTTAE
jgi:Ca2+-binding EF-hand superfamily protein